MSEHTEACRNREPFFKSSGLGSDCELEDCDCQCHAETEAFDENDNRYKWPEDRR